MPELAVVVVAAVAVVALARAVDVAAVAVATVAVLAQCKLASVVTVLLKARRCPVLNGCGFHPLWCPAARDGGY